MPTDNSGVSKKHKAEDQAVTNFREYLRCKTVHPNPDYESAVIFLQKMARELDLPCSIIYVTGKEPVVIITWEGEDPSLPSIMLNSHIDVVPVFPEHWACDPFEAKKTENGDIIARGSQDMKCVGIQYIEAIRRLKEQGKRFLRTIHMTFVPDEEVGGFKGMAIFVKHEHFKNMNVGFAMDEGLASPTDVFSVFYGEKSPWWITVTAHGDPGHGSRFIENTAAEKIHNVINSFMAFRADQKNKLESDPNLTIGDVVSVNMTIIKGGVQHNVVPAEISAAFDMRVPPTTDLVEFQSMVEKWATDAGKDVNFEWNQQCHTQVVTRTDEDYPWWHALSSTCKKMGLKIRKEVFPAATDSRYIRQVGIPALGFSPMNNTPILLHDHNEYLNEDIFLRGIDIYCDLIPKLAGVKPFTDEN
ncbi:aminoacylase-1-like isoform X1 [Tubulanus polymorphus]|uniref:aminoacylase-1-like isoform X1 n=1 Tax=Tubulanus polymorphus TaxID=672921 RepID=UPI003DA24176